MPPWQQQLAAFVFLLLLARAAVHYLFINTSHTRSVVKVVMARGQRWTGSRSSGLQGQNDLIRTAVRDHFGGFPGCLPKQLELRSTPS